MKYAFTLFLKFSVRCIHPNYLFYSFKCVRRVCPNLLSAPCRCSNFFRYAKESYAFTHGGQLIRSALTCTGLVSLCYIYLISWPCSHLQTQLTKIAVQELHLGSLCQSEVIVNPVHHQLLTFKKGQANICRNSQTCKFSGSLRYRKSIIFLGLPSRKSEIYMTNPQITNPQNFTT